MKVLKHCRIIGVLIIILVLGRIILIDRESYGYQNVLLSKTGILAMLQHNSFRIVRSEAKVISPGTQLTPDELRAKGFELREFVVLKDDSSRATMSEEVKKIWEGSEIEEFTLYLVCPKNQDEIKDGKYKGLDLIQDSKVQRILDFYDLFPIVGYYWKGYFMDNDYLKKEYKNLISEHAKIDIILEQDLKYPKLSPEEILFYDRERNKIHRDALLLGWVLYKDRITVAEEIAFQRILKLYPSSNNYIIVDNYFCPETRGKFIVEVNPIGEENTEVREVIIASVAGDEWVYKNGTQNPYSEEREKIRKIGEALNIDHSIIIEEFYHFHHSYEIYVAGIEMKCNINNWRRVLDQFFYLYQRLSENSDLTVEDLQSLLEKYEYLGP